MEMSAHTVASLAFTVASLERTEASLARVLASLACTVPLVPPAVCMQLNFWKSMYTLPSGSVKIYKASVQGESLTLYLFHCTSCTTTCNIFLQLTYILLNTSFPAHCLSTIVLPYDLLKTLFFPHVIHISLLMVLVMQFALLLLKNIFS